MGSQIHSPIAWALVVHAIGFVFWIGGLLAATMVMAAHTRETSLDGRQALARLEKRLLNGFAAPGALLTILAGITMLWVQPDYLHEAWLHAKLLLVLIILILHVLTVTRAAAFGAGRIELQRRECMMLHGAISFMFLGIVILVVVKPF